MRFRRPLRSIDEPIPAKWSELLLRPVKQVALRAMLPKFARHVSKIEEVRHVALVHLDSLGDAILLGPVLRNLRAFFGDATITLAHNDAHSSFFELCPYTDHRVPIQVAGKPSEGKAHGEPKSRWSVYQQIAKGLARIAQQAGPVDLVVGPDWLDPVNGLSFFDNVLCKMGSAPSILRDQHRRGNRAPVEVRQHHVSRNLDILRALGIPVVDSQLEAWLSVNDRAVATSLLPPTDPERPTIAASIGAGLALKRWPLERLESVLRVLHDRLDARMVLVGGASERNLLTATKLGCSPGLLDFVGRLSIRETGAVLERCDVLIGNDSGPVHLAAAVQTPSVVLNAHALDGYPWVVNSPVRYRPWGVCSAVLQPGKRLFPCDGKRTCRADEAHCILQITPEQVVDATIELIS